MNGEERRKLIDKLSDESKKKLDTIWDDLYGVYFDPISWGTDCACVDGHCSAEELRMMADIMDELKALE